MSESKQPDQLPTVPIPAFDPAPQGSAPPGGQPPAQGQVPAHGQPPARGQVPVYDRGGQGAGRRNLVLAAVVALVVGLGAGFAVGRQTAPAGPATLAEAIQLAGAGKLPNGDLSSVRGNAGGIFRRGGQNGQGQGAQGQGGQGQNGQAAPGAGQNGNGRGGGQRGVQATVSAVSGDTVTLQTPAGALRVRIGPDTKIQKAAQGTKSDITPGSRVTVNFDLNGSSDDGSVAAASILAEGQAS